MMTDYKQKSLFDPVPPAEQELLFTVNSEMRAVEYPESDQGMTTAEKFLAFHQVNSFVYSFMQKLAQQLYDEGIGRVSIQYLVTSFRIYGQRTMGTEYKISNILSPYYARLLRALNPHFATNDFIVIKSFNDAQRELEADKMIAEIVAEMAGDQDG